MSRMAASLASLVPLTYTILRAMMREGPNDVKHKTRQPPACLPAGPPHLSLDPGGISSSWPTLSRAPLWSQMLVMPLPRLPD